MMRWNTEIPRNKHCVVLSLRSIQFQSILGVPCALNASSAPQGIYPYRIPIASSSVDRCQVALLCNSAGSWRMAVRNRRTPRNWAETCIPGPDDFWKLGDFKGNCAAPRLGWWEHILESWNNLHLERDSHQFSRRAIQWSAGKDGSSMIFAFIPDLGLSNTSGIHGPYTHFTAENG